MGPAMDQLWRLDLAMCLAEFSPSAVRLPGSGEISMGIHAISHCSIASSQEAPDTRYWPACQAPGTPWEASDPSLFVPGRAEPIGHTPAAAADHICQLQGLTRVPGGTIARLELFEVPYEIASPRHDISLRSSISLLAYSTKFGTDVCNGVAEAAATAQGVEAHCNGAAAPTSKAAAVSDDLLSSPLTPQVSCFVRYGLGSMWSATGMLGVAHPGACAASSVLYTRLRLEIRGWKLSSNPASTWGARSLRLSPRDDRDPPPAALTNQDRERE
ncbi:uncharacterized protein BO96DRAFT_335282 [Aspergillus niger CBS 101883]|uniref:Uncharacterized protein n=2 Tax=Aspergillus niger TaxID=5061 RepID=A2QNE7_ASPNC|nr:uncharacterized protein BO96DRAFT_335282 [Aspergillus niger CBS 101883]XP_059600950.1 hypothetical protein An07g05400 [Aspergillus niger]PYH57516.1 hypothetical protein BO96DRAFT_335282 [Aspergillus niger CBS 101883]CAK39456.1 hypothetical protein An07g05400 [Aspergillus niger]